VGAQPDRGRGGQQGVGVGHGGYGGLALDELGVVFGGDVGVQHRGGVLEQLLSLAVVAGSAHQILPKGPVRAS
jgi:hypothetical protein